MEGSLALKGDCLLPRELVGDERGKKKSADNAKSATRGNIEGGFCFLHYRKGYYEGQFTFTIYMYKRTSKNSTGFYSKQGSITILKQHSKHLLYCAYYPLSSLHLASPSFPLTTPLILSLLLIPYSPALPLTPFHSSQTLPFLYNFSSTPISLSTPLSLSLTFPSHLVHIRQ